MHSDKISIATETDIDSLVLLVNSAYRGESSKAGWTTEADLLDGQRTDPQSMHELLTKPGSTILKLLHENGELVGCVNLQLTENDLYLGMLTVLPTLQGGGVGKKLLKAAEQYAAALGAQSIIMTVISVRKELIEWYQRQGYQLTGQTKPFPEGDPRFGLPRQPLVFVIMKKQISRPVD